MYYVLKKKVSARIKHHYGADSPENGHACLLSDLLCVLGAFCMLLDKSSKGHGLLHDTFGEIYENVWKTQHSFQLLDALIDCHGQQRHFLF